MDGSRSEGPRIELGSGATRVVFPLVLRETLIGRIDSNHVVLDHASVSRIHARLHRVGDRIELEDCGSSLGSQVNGELVDRVFLKHGDVVKLGAVSLLFLED